MHSFSHNYGQKLIFNFTGASLPWLMFTPYAEKLTLYYPCKNIFKKFRRNLNSYHKISIRNFDLFNDEMYVIK